MEAMFARDASVLGAYQDEKSFANLSSTSKTLAKKIQTIRKHFTRTSHKHDGANLYDDQETSSLSNDCHSPTPQQAFAAMTLHRSIPIGDTSANLYGAPSQAHGSYSFGFVNDMSPRQQQSYYIDNVHQQSLASEQRSVSTSYTSYQTQTFTMHSHQGARIVFFSLAFNRIETLLNYERACCLHCLTRLCTPFLVRLVC